MAQCHKCLKEISEKDWGICSQCGGKAVDQVAENRRLKTLINEVWEICGSSGSHRIAKIERLIMENGGPFDE